MAGRPKKITEFNALHKVEDFNGEEVPVFPEDPNGSLGWKMSKEEKLSSILNTVKILPPNMVVDGRHTLENIQALNCFKISLEMVDEVYKNFSHEAI